LELAGVTDTGERIDLESEALSHVKLKHLGRYEWAAPQVAGRVLDVACGTGYGTAMLARRSDVSGLDADPGAVELARRRVPHGTFQRGELPPIPWSPASFDAVVSFETIEHIDDDAAYLAEIRRVLRPGGLLLLSTPNKEVNSPHGPPANPWHVREYRLEDLLALLEGFDEVEVWMQDAVPRTLSERSARKLVARFPSLCKPGRWWDRLAHGDGAVESWDGSSAPRNWVLRARR
jgi:SAM-dependent methyltransferase